MSSISQFFGGGTVVGGWAMPILGSKSITFTQAGTVVISIMSAGGAGAAGNTTTGAATGGNSAPWGRKKIKVAIGDVLTFTMAASAVSPATDATNGSNGGTTTVTLNGTTILTCQGGEGGVYGSPSATSATPVATITGADFWVPGVRAGNATFSASVATTSGGAAVDLLRTGLGRSPDRTTANTAIGGTVGTNLGGAYISWIELAMWGMVITDQSLASSTVSIPGRGGDVSGSIRAGAFAGSGVSNNKSGFGAGGPGAQQGGVGTLSGEAYAYITFTPLS